MYELIRIVTRTGNHGEHTVIFGIKNDRPLVNRSTLGIYPPGSTVKPFMAVSALTEGVITPSTTRNDPGWWRIPNSNTRPFRDWLRWGHGKVNVTKALEESVDTFFYQVAFDMGIDRISTWMKKFGFGDYSGYSLVDKLLSSTFQNQG